ncbi:MAG: DUF2149 domain-containing protein [Candidatus Omnitrophica bacterium]|nr:DUF2149 domain-containing protein [Candidatus Omnitrophota bacterium]
MKRHRGYKKLSDYDDDPLSGMANLFDLAMVFAVALMVAVVTRMQIAEVFTEDDVTLVKNPGKENMEIIVKKGKEIERYKASGKTSEGQGKRIGAAYELEDGKVIYVPE